MFKFSDFKINSQLVLMLTIGFVIVILGVSSVFSSQKSLDLAKKVDVTRSQFTQVITTKDDLSLYEFLLNQWSHGDIPREDVQTANNILLQQLDTKSIKGISLTQLAIPGFLTSLRNVEDLLSKAPEGFLPETLQKQYHNQVQQTLNMTQSAGSRLIADYQNIVSEQIQSDTDLQRSAVLRNLYLQLASRILAIIFIVWFLLRTHRRNRQQSLELNSTQQRLGEVRANLGVAHEAVASLREENREKTEIVSTVNHELRTPLTSIIGYIDILKDFSVTENDKEFQNHLGVMERNAAVLLELVESILSLSALNTRDSLSDTSIVDLVDRCEICVGGLVLQIESANININSNFDLATSYTVQGNDALLSQVFTNLISNAIKFSPKNSQIDITFTRTISETLGAIVRVEISDHGIGIPDEDIDQVFTSFYRAGNTSGSEIPGSGLGLAIVKRIVNLHGGDIYVKSAIGVGTTMIVDLPVQISPVEALVMEQRQDVLERAIKSLADCDVADLAATAHDVGGAIGFYTFWAESIEVLDLSRWLEKNPQADEKTVLLKREAVLDTLNTALARIREAEES